MGSVHVSFSYYQTGLSEQCLTSHHSWKKNLVESTTWLEVVEDEAEMLAEVVADGKAEEEVEMKAEAVVEVKAEDEVEMLAEVLAEGKAEEEAEMKAEAVVEGKAEEEAGALCWMLCCHRKSTR